MKIYHGDCLDVMKNFDDNSVDMILCDLPYGTTSCSWDVVIPFDELWKQYKRIAKDNTPFVLFSQTPFDKVLGCSNLSWLKYEWIWEKTIATGHLNSMKMPMKSHENILVFYKNLPTYNPQKTNGKPYNGPGGKSVGEEHYGSFGSERKGSLDGSRFPRSVVKFNIEHGLHPTQKPVSLLEYLIKTYTNENDVVLDNCMGSGSTGVACLNTKREFIGIEKEDKYFQIAKERLESHEQKLSSSKNLNKFIRKS